MLMEQPFCFLVRLLACLFDPLRGCVAVEYLTFICHQTVQCSIIGLRRSNSNINPVEKKIIRKKNENGILLQIIIDITTKHKKKDSYIALRDNLVFVITWNNGILYKPFS